MAENAAKHILMEIRKEKSARQIKILAMDGEKMAGRISLLAPVHVEHVFIEKKYRGKGLFRKLMDEAEAEARKLDVPQVFAYATSIKMGKYIKRRGYSKLPMTVWVKELPCQT